MPGVGRFPCETCEYVASNKRMLSRHVLVAHSDKVYKCPVCPFITRYAANWYRHKRDLHGLSKLTTCEVCGFFASSAEDLFHHTEAKHPEHLHKLEERRQRLSSLQNPSTQVQKDDVQEDDQEVAQLNGNGATSEDGLYTDNVVEDDSVKFSLPVNGGFLESDLNFVDDKAKPDDHSPAKMNVMRSEYGELSPPKIRRSYCCNLCGLLTSNPREFLYHQRDVHGMRINVFECKLCIYASKHVQKLQRHYGLVHRQKMSAEDKPPPMSKAAKNKKVANKPNFAIKEVPFANDVDMVDTPYEFPDDEPEWPAPLRTDKPKPGGMLKCAACNYQTRNKFLLINHEKTVHFKKKFFRCVQCGYVTNERARYTKHIKYHSLPKMQCEFCHFKSAYKWNMDRHLKNHMTGREGEYNCTLCTFITHNKQSLKMHVVNHHQPEESANEFQNEECFPENSLSESNNDSNEFGWANNFETGIPEVECNLSVPESISPKVDKRPSFSWGQATTSKLLQCKSCDYQTKWSFQMRKHEEIHKVKRHSCPLCGMRFEHIAWLTKHLNRIHKGNSQAQNIAAAFEMLKPNRRRSNSSQASISSTSNESASKAMDVRSNVESQSVLSSLLRNSAPPKYSQAVPKTDFANKFKHPGMEPPKRPLENKGLEDRAVPLNKKRAPPCRICGYHTKWISELEKHMRVHSSEKPFRCSRCSYHSKWKGDLTRHLMKHHGIKVPVISRKVSVPKLKLKKAMPNQLSNHWHSMKESANAGPDSESSAPTAEGGKDQDSPLDLTIGKCSDDEDFMPEYISGSNEEINDEDNFEPVDLRRDSRHPSDGQSDIHMTSMSSSMYSSFDPHKADQQPEETELGPLGKRKYHCPFCTFTTSTPSRFHVHIVQHYNKKPFMCSQCGYRSNWEWDITKHIRLRGCKDKEHNSACVLLTDETGRRNYEKYDKYLREEHKTIKPQKNIFHKTRAASGLSLENTNSNTEYVKEVATPNPPAAASEEAPVNIVVTPDIPFADDGMEQLDMGSYSNDYKPTENNPDASNNGFKFYVCKHCNYKHSSRKVVIGHLSVHAGVRPFRCKVCSFTANWRHIVVRHVKVAHNGYMNDVEDRITYIQEGFVIRITSVKNSRTYDPGSRSTAAQYTCKFCPYKCDKEVYIKFHMKQHKPREGAIYQCTHCPYYVKFKKTLVRHMKLHEPPQPEENMEFSDKNDDMYPENQDFSNVEDECAQTLPLNEDSAVSYSSNQVEYPDGDSIAVNFSQLSAQDTAESYDPIEKLKRHVCEHCPYRTDNRTQYLYHKQFHRPNNSAPFKCSLCSYWATMQHLLTQHMKVHRNDMRRNSFDNADTYEMLPPKGVSYQEQDSMDQLDDFSEIPIVLVHREGISTKMFKCRFCPMMNKKRANVRVHERMHGATQIIGKYTCSLCNYKCLSQGSLTNHMKIHQNSDGFEISSLQLESQQPSTVADDIANANRKKVFSYFCMRCPAVFKSSSDLYIHRTFHGSNLPYPCPHCDYRAKHKPHLQKHLQVHTSAYVTKRDASYGPPINPDCDNAAEFLLDSSTPPPTPENKRIDQMLLLEVAEVKMFLKRGRDFAMKRMHKCPLCPAYFSKSTVLAYHCTLHGSSGEFACTQCNYATIRSANLSVHTQVHSKTDGIVRRPLRQLQCPKCPASFTKTDRYERHLDLHGKNYRYQCNLCDYSVRFAANLSKHKTVHYNAEKNMETTKDENQVIAENIEALNRTMSSEKSASEVEKSPEIGEEKKTYICDRCPYYQGRKDAVQSHQQRHFQKDGYECPHCDYRSMGSSFLREHVKSHIQPNNLFLPQAYIKCNGFKIWQVDGDSKDLLFEDKGREYDLCSRFYPELKSRDDLVTIGPDIDEAGTSALAIPTSDNEGQMSEEHQNIIEAPDSEGMILETVAADEKEPLLPKVLLKDIFAEGRELKELENEPWLDTCRKKKLLDLAREIKSANAPIVRSNQDGKKRPHDKVKSKSSIIVKIRVENIVEDNNERSLYTISSKKSNKTDSCSDAASDITIPADDIEDVSPSGVSNDVELDKDCEAAEGDSFSENSCSKEAGFPGEVNGNLFSPGPASMQRVVDFHDRKLDSYEMETDFLKQLDFMVNNVAVNSNTTQ